MSYLATFGILGAMVAISAPSSSIVFKTPRICGVIGRVTGQPTRYVHLGEKTARIILKLTHGRIPVYEYTAAEHCAMVRARNNSYEEIARQRCL
jgi:hypothetical protein